MNLLDIIMNQADQNYKMNYVHPDVTRVTEFLQKISISLLSQEDSSQGYKQI